MSDRQPCLVDSCPRRFDSVVALEFHLKSEHPSTHSLARSILRGLYRAERKEAKAQTDPGQLHPKLLALYRAGCPCGRTLQQHREARRGLGTWA